MSALLLGMLLGMVLAVLLGLLLVWAWESEWAQKMSEETELDSGKLMQQSLQQLQETPKEADK
jgi:hypothetical protein